MKNNKNPALSETLRFLRVVHDLRTQCPWDKKQTHRSLRPYVIEEAFEVVDAIDSGNLTEIEEELGDLLLQVVLHSEILSEKDPKMNFESVAKRVSEKMIYRHPHVYANVKVKDEAEVRKNWTELKEKEKVRKSQLDGIPKKLPALMQAQKFGSRASRVGFDWKNPKQVLEKVDEEILELKKECNRRKIDKAAIEEELGDVLFTLTNLARHYGIDAELSLRKGNRKFKKRFDKMEGRAKKEKKKLSECSAKELEQLWNAIK